jgi:hypothetical protein
MELKTLIFLLLFTVPLFAQQKVAVIPFPATTDTINNLFAQDTVQFRGWYSGLTEPSWINLSSEVYDSVYVSNYCKLNEQTRVYNIANESWWTWFNIGQLRILSNADTITSVTFSIGDASGAITIFVQPDTIASPDTATVYKVRVGGL